jgi:hypothetical protein
MCSTEPVGLRKLLVLGLCASLLTSIATGQTNTQGGRPDVLTIVNLHQTDVPGDRARVLLLTTCRVVAEEFHRSTGDIDLRVTLVLGESSERVAVGDYGDITLYLERWNESKFVDGLITAAFERLATLRSRREMFTEIVRRTDKIAPVAANQLRMPRSNSPLPNRSLVPDCISAVNNTPCSWLNRLPYR